MKHWPGVVLTGAVLAIGVCTLVSAKNYAEDLAVVTLTYTAPNCIREELTVDGEILYEEVMDVKLPGGCTVEEVYVQAGSWIEAQGPILRLKESDLQIAYYEMLLREESLEEAADEEGNRGELARWQQVQLKEEMELLEKLISDEGVISAQEEAYVIYQGYEEGKKTAGESLLRLGLAEKGYRLEWSVDMSHWRAFTTGNALIGEDR